MTTNAEKTVEAMLVGRELFDLLYEKKSFSLDQCITIANEIKKSVYDKREKRENEVPELR